jgi:DNA-3-methyladenine glycosylase II
VVNPRINQADAHLARVDRVMRRLVRDHGPWRRRRAADQGPFAALVRIVVGQMISVSAARTVYGRLLVVLGEEQPTPARVLQRGVERLRTAGLSRSKAQALVALASVVADGELDLERARRWRSDRVKAALMEVRGIGEWTANIYLLGHLRRRDVFPARDLGVLEGIRRAYRLEDRPTPAQALARAEPWAPYRSAAAWYLWRVVDAQGPVSKG